ncbi:MAG: permease-like cell division protein FtsX [Muribaculaceae bacterium]|jgi:cell division transport system permease protein|nr:permease-like cell division protein FtsX [Muribaculaceae bacterium]
MAEQEKKSKISFINANITSIISVALVLLLLGLVALLGCIARSFADQIRENIGFEVVLTDSASTAQINSVKNLLTDAKYVSSVKYISKDEAMQQWQNETGENLIDLFGVNPLAPEFDVNVKAAFESPDSLTVISAKIKKFAAVENVYIHQDVVESVNRNINSAMVVLSVVAAMMMIISFALINNTVRLTVYSRRFIIHTMKLVGAKPSFIRRPFVISNVVNGVIAALLAIVILAAGIYYLLRFEPAVATLLSLSQVWLVFGGMIVLGAALCAAAAAIATNRYISLSYDELFTM